MHRKKLRAICILLCALQYIFSIPTISAAKTKVEIETTANITEVISRREEYTKHFDLGNGTYQAVVYDNAVHRLDDNGQWQEINNNLYLNDAKGNQHYQDNYERVSFNANLSLNQPIFALSDDGTSISMGLTSDAVLLDTESTVIRPTITNAPEKRSTSQNYNTLDEAIQFDNTCTVLYEDIINGIDIEYILVGNDIKENIIVKENFESYSYTFALELNGLYPQLSEGGSVLLLDSKTDAEKYVIPSPYMYDANNEISFDVSYTLRQDSELWLLTITADENWCNSTDRLFPITIDPTVKSTSGVSDTYITSAHPTTNYGNNGQLWVSAPPSDRLNGATYLQFDLPTIPVGSTINNASINTYYCYPNHVTDGYITVAAYEMQYAWAESRLTWDTASNCGNTLGTSDYCLDYAQADGGIGATPHNPKTLSFSITSLVQSWYNGRANHGIALKYLVGNKWSVIMKSSENTTGDYCPWIYINYTSPPHTHQYEIISSDGYQHPHEIISRCSCGSERSTYPLNSLCSDCRKNEKLATNTVTKNLPFAYIADDEFGGVAIFTGIDCSVTYTNYYSYLPSTPYNYPPFATFSSSVISSGGSSAHPQLTCISDLTVTYYNAVGEVLWEQSMQWNLDNNSIPKAPMHVYTLTSKPAYAVTGATFSMPQTAWWHYVEVTTYFE